MRVVDGLYDGKSVHPMERVNAKPNTRVKITFPDEEAADEAAQTSALDAVAGCLKWSGSAKTIEEMDEAIARGAKERPS
ncbi:MAG: hypothetical protein M0R80_28895 [Proteobacteria bacterium]|nr:hypothetical protein [Pseudomonadota bacterium]